MALGPFPIPASRDAAPAPGRFPVVLLSHGGGPTGGTPLILGELSASLARQGFVVVAPFHGKAGLRVRALQARSALDAVLADPRFWPHADRVRLGMIGFSLGTAVTLELAGGIPNPAHLVAYCGAHPDDAMSCQHAPDGNNPPAPGQPFLQRLAIVPAPLPLKAIVLLDPFAVLFQHDELTAVTMPVLLFRPTAASFGGMRMALGLPAHCRTRRKSRSCQGGISSSTMSARPNCSLPRRRPARIRRASTGRRFTGRSRG